MAIMYLLTVLGAVVGFASFAVDYGKVTLAKTELRRSVDAACLAGCSGLSVSPTEARNRAKAYALSNSVNGSPLTLLDSDIELGSWNGTTKQFTVFTGANESKATAIRITGRLTRARGTAVGLVLLPLIQGPSACEMTTSAVAGTGASTSDIVIAQDVSTSFSEELADAKVGDQALLNGLQAQGGTSAMGIVVFAGTAKTMASEQTISGNYTVLSNAITAIKLAGNAGMPSSWSGTDIAAGIEQALGVFNAYGASASSSRALIIVSDGTPTQSWFGKHPTLNAAQLLALAQQDADTCWAQKIHVYVVFFDRNNDAQAAARLRTLIRGSGVFVQVQNPNDLPAALASITQMLPRGLVQ
jgi:hypothetical protein